MKILIEDARRISSIQKRFEARFPYLRLAFFTKAHKRGQSSAWKDLADPRQTVGELRDPRPAGKIEIHSGMTVTGLEETFRRDFGLSVQVFRRSGDTWLETTATDTWTLEKQQREAAFMATRPDPDA